ncbi:MAG: TlpA family protein disulfide reductase [Polyangiaceae bacterium]|nr:TlpA family protein disulfide reductase [Polyangiaceae bacterium]
MQPAILAAFAAFFSLFTAACAKDANSESAKSPGSPGSPGNYAAVNAKASSSVEGGIQEGDKAPSFSIDSVNGQGQVAITPGKVTLVDLWATWCYPCKQNFPKYQEIYAKYKENGLEIAAVSVDDEKDSVIAFAAASGATFPIGWDEGRKIENQFQPAGVPTLYVIGKDGTVKHIHRGESAGNEIQLDKEIENLL